MNHSIKLRHGWYNLHFDAHDAGDEDGNGDLEVQNVDVDADEDVDDSIKITVKACRICILMAAPCWSLVGSLSSLSPILLLQSLENSAKVGRKLGEKGQMPVAAWPLLPHN